MNFKDPGLQMYGGPLFRSIQEKGETAFLTLPAIQSSQPAPRDAVMWGDAGRFNMGSLLKGGVVQSVRGENVGFSPKDANITRGPKAASYVADHENLQIKK